MARYEAMGRDVYDHQEHDFLTAQEIAEFFNSHAGMKTREEVETDENSFVRDGVKYVSVNRDKCHEKCAFTE